MKRPLTAESRFFYLVFYLSQILYFISIQTDGRKMFALMGLKCPSYNVTTNISFHLGVIIIETIRILNQKLEPSLVLRHIVVIRL